MGDANGFRANALSNPKLTLMRTLAARAAWKTYLMETLMVNRLGHQKTLTTLTQ